MKKNQIESELKVTKEILIEERLFLIEDQCSFRTLMSTHYSDKSIELISPMFDEIKKFIEYRESFLQEKENQLFHYITHIRKIEDRLDRISCKDYESIEDLLRLMLASISRAVPKDVFGEPF